MNKEQIKYIESDLESILATQATKLDLAIQFGNYSVVDDVIKAM